MQSMYQSVLRKKNPFRSPVELMMTENLIEAMGCVYLLYCLFETQPYETPTLIRVTIGKRMSFGGGVENWNVLFQICQKAKGKNSNVERAISRLVEKNAFLTVALHSNEEPAPEEMAADAEEEEDDKEEEDDEFQTFQ